VPPVHDYALIGGIAAVSTYLLTFPLRWLAARISFVAAPDDRRVHSQLIPYGGGLAMFLAFVAAMIVADHIANLHGIYQGSSEPLGVVLGAAIILAVGLLDDAREISAPAKVAGQVLAAMVLVFLGATMFWLKVPLAGTVVLSSDVTPLLTALWVIGITNAINLIDGLDGLAAGIVAIASGALAVYGLRLVQLGLLQPTNLGPLIAVITCGVSIGFLPHNFNPAKVFMGDAGALFLGLLMAAATMEIGGRTEGVTGQTYFFYAPLFLPLFILGVPIADMAFAYIRRAVKGTPIDTPDNDHVHHRLVRLGHGPRRTVLILWTWTAALSGFVLFPLFAPESNAIIPFAAIVLGLVLYTLFHPGLRPGRRKRRTLAANAAAEAAAVATAEAGIAAEIRLAAASANGAGSTNGAAPGNGVEAASRAGLANDVELHNEAELGNGTVAGARVPPDKAGPRPETALS
jgi:UDP-GlcNAc:undecaprenyl-phosphate/decaprenyl-phosphate GlcNAc-1-phosphate transferase